MNQKSVRKHILIIAYVYFIFTNLMYGQQRGGGMPPNANIVIIGKVVDENKKPISFATVVLLKGKMDKTTLLTGTQTEDNGEFIFENISPSEPLRIQISNLGYEIYEQALEIKPGQSDLDLKTISLKESAEKLNELIVTASASSMRMDIDKKIFNVSANTVTIGGTGEDVLKTVPSLNVDVDGNITLRNASPTFLLDGRPTLLTPDQIPADAIESIEVITNPSANYDASGGTGGIVNIVMKKNKKSGYNGNLRLGGESVGAYNAGLDFNFRQNKINFSFNSGYRANRNLTTGEMNRNIITNNVESNRTIQDLDEEMKGAFANIKTGIDYFATNKTTLSIAANFNRGFFMPKSDQLFEIDNLVDSLRSDYSLRSSDSDRTFKNNGLIFGMKHLFTTNGDEITFDANYNERMFDGETNVITDYYADHGQSTVSSRLGQDITSFMKNKSIVLQSDLVKNTSSKIKIETGIRVNINDRATENRNYMVDLTSNIRTEVINPTSNFENKDYVYAAYVSLSRQYSKTGVKAGVRAESFAFEGFLPALNQKSDYNYPIQLFPSLFISHKLSEQSDFQISYSRRVNRPGFWQNVPFADSTDRFNITKGNPNLVPEFSSNFEIGHMKRFKNNHSLLTNLYYKYTDNLISGFVEDDGKGTLINTYINANSSYATGLEVTTQLYLTKAIDANWNFNVYNSKILLNNLGENVIQPDALWSWFTKLNTNIKILKGYNLQLIGQYQSKSNLAAESGEGRRGGGGGMGRGGHFGPPGSNAQGFIKSYGSMDIAIRKQFMKNKFTVVIGINDVFASRYFRTYSENIYFNQSVERISNPRLLRLNLTYAFGKADTLLFKRKSKGAEEAPE